MSDLLIKNGTIVTMDEQKTLYQKGNIYIVDGRIAQIGTDEMGPEHPARVIDADHHIVMPGFVNTHSHLQQYFRGIYELIGDFYTVNLPLEGYRLPEDMETLGLASAAEFIAGGCTTALVIYTYPDGFAKAVEQAGNRVYLAADIEETDLPRLQEGYYAFLPEKGKAGFKRAEELYEQWHGKANGRITTLMCPKAPDLVSPELYLKIKAYAMERGLKLTTHLAQSTREYNQVMKLFGVSPTQHLKNLGILDDQLLAAHCVYTSAQDEQLIKENGTAIMQSRFITAPFMRWVDMGIPVGLGTDDYYHDMLQLLRELRQGQNHRSSLIAGLDQMQASSRYTNRLSYYDLLEMATRKSAEAIGMGDQIGSLEVGKKADILTIDLNNPFLSPSLDPVTSLVLYGSAANIDHVIVDGDVVKCGSTYTNLDLPVVLEKAQGRVETICDRFFADYPDQLARWKSRIQYHAC